MDSVDFSFPKAVQEKGGKVVAMDVSFDFAEDVTAEQVN